MNRGTLFLATCLMAAPAASLAQAPATPVPAVPTAGAQPITLRYKFTAGETRRYHLVMDTNGTVAGAPGGQTIPLKQHMDIRLHQITQSVQDTSGTATVKIGIDSMTMTMNGRAIPLPQNMLSGMKDIGTLVETTTGKIQSFTGGPGATGGLPGMDMSRMSGMQSAMSLPQDPVKPGDTWSSTMDLSKQFNLPGTATAAAQLALTSVDTSGATPVALIHTTMSSDMDTAGQAGPGGMPMATKITGDGDEKFDVAAGVVTSQTGTTHIHMTMTPPANGQAAAAPLNIDMDATTHMDLLPDAPAPAVAAPAPPDPALTPQTGEIRLEGTVRQTASGQKRLVLLASRAQDAGQAAKDLTPPRQKIVVVRPTTTLRPANGGTALSAFQPGDTVIVVGTSQGAGLPLVARIIAAQ